MYGNDFPSQPADNGRAHESHKEGSLQPLTGILDIVDNRAFVRTDGYLPGPRDAHVSLGLVREHGLRRGDTVTGRARTANKGEKLAPLVQVDTINGQHPRRAMSRAVFSELVPLYPNERMRLETEPHALTTRVADLLVPVGKGQRALIVAPPKAGKTSVLQAIAHGLAKNHPECHLMLVLVGERPEEVTDLARAVPGEVIAATFDHPP
ncbi:MAG: transcription termination factor Rho, partial [Pseudonocardiaceae bacterium]